MIDAQYQLIASNRQKITSIEETIEDLNAALTRVDGVTDAVISASKKYGTQFSGSIGAIGWVKSLAKATFFGDIYDLVTGNRYHSAVNSMDTARERINQKIRELSGQIEQLEGDIRNSYSSIERLKAEKKRDQERREQEAALSNEA